jgi:hypothetical protein
LAQRLFNRFGRLPVRTKQLESAERIFKKLGLLVWICAIGCQTVCFDLDYNILIAFREDLHNLLSALGATVASWSETCFERSCVKSEAHTSLKVVEKSRTHTLRQVVVKNVAPTSCLVVVKSAPHFTSSCNEE